MEVEIIIQIIILLIAVYLAFFKSYLTEKGKNAALKEDVEVLTRKVESVKDVFVKEQEIVKTNLQRTLGNEVSYRNEERDAIIKFHATINQWLYSILEVRLSGYNRNNVSDLVKIRNANSSFYAKTGVAKSKILLLVEDVLLVKATHDLYIAVMQFHNWADVQFLKYQHNCELQRDLIDRFIIEMKKDKEDLELEKAMGIDEKKLKEEQEEMYNSYITTNRNFELEKIQPHKTLFEDLVKGYLKK